MCFGSFATVLSKCKAPSVTQKELIGRMLLVVNPKYDITADDVAVSALVRGMNNLSDDVTLYLDGASASFRNVFAGMIVPMLDANRKSNIVLAFKDILEEDTDIDDHTVIELVNGLTKADFINRDSIVFDELIAGLFLYVAKYTDTENYNKAHHLSNQQFLEMDKEFAILNYVAECPDIFDSMSSEEMVEEIDRYISAI